MRLPVELWTSESHAKTEEQDQKPDWGKRQEQDQGMERTGTISLYRSTGIRASRSASGLAEGDE